MTALTTLQVLSILGGIFVLSLTIIAVVSWSRVASQKGALEAMQMVNANLKTEIESLTRRVNDNDKLRSRVDELEREQQATRERTMEILDENRELHKRVVAKSDDRMEHIESALTRLEKILERQTLILDGILWRGQANPAPGSSPHSS